MPHEQLLALATDVDRLLAAGAATATGNDTLRRRAGVLRDLGRKVPALNAVADAAERVVQASPKKATPAVLDLVTTMRQVRASLSTAGVLGEKEDERDVPVWVEYLENVMKKRGAEWRELYAACKELTS